MLPHNPESAYTAYILVHTSRYRGKRQRGHRMAVNVICIAKVTQGG